jgi:hypothetical protein
MNSKFIITGDSWSQGEWDGYPDNYRITHSGVYQYLIEEGYTVTNVGRGGYNNNESLAALIAELPNNNYTHCIFFFTDPLRQTSYEQFSTTFPSSIIHNHVNHLLENLDNLSKETGIKIVIVGGCAKLIFKDYVPTNIDVVIPSLSELLVPEFVDNEFMHSKEWEEHWLKLETKCSFEHKKAIYDVYNSAGIKFDMWKNRKDLFWPDGIHANRRAHKILFDYLIDNLNLS